MINTVKQRYFKKVYDNATFVLCKCGCGNKLKNKDKYGRDVSFLNGHNRKKYSDPKQHKREWNHRNRNSRYEWKKKYHRKRKVKLLGLFGNECKQCGIKYNGKNACIFHFHHLDSTTKSFSVGNNVVNKKWDTLVEECKKCILICANCHEMRHSGEF